jgi:hypothetical protein
MKPSSKATTTDVAMAYDNTDMQRFDWYTPTVDIPYALEDL